MVDDSDDLYAHNLIACDQGRHDANCTDRQVATSRLYHIYIIVVDDMVDKAQCSNTRSNTWM